MFYNDIQIKSNSSPDHDFDLIVNFFDKLPDVMDEITTGLFYNTQNIFDENKMYYSINKIPEVIGDHFKLIINAKREFSLKRLLKSENLLRKLDANGLIGDSLIMKFQLLDLIWEKAKNLISELRGGLNVGLFQSLINSLKSMLNSILNALGINPDIFNEDFSILLSLIELSNNTHLKTK